MNSTWFTRSVLALSLVGVLPAAYAVAQSPLPKLEDEAALSKVKGLSGLGDQELMRELGARGLESLLNRALDLNKVPDNRRASMLTLLALRELSNPDRDMSARKRQEKVAQISKDIDAALPEIKDPQLLIEYAAKLIVFGVERDVNTLEYWGENPRTQATLKPVIESVLKILDKARDEATATAEKLANQISGPNDPAADKWVKMDELLNSAIYTRHMAEYYLVLAMDASDPNRKTVINESIEFLTQFDNADSQVMPVVHSRLAKLNLAKGEYGLAKKMFEELGSAASTIAPPPTIEQQFEGKYFSILCDLNPENPQWEAVDKGVNELIAWYKTNLPQDKPVQDGANAAISMLKYRVNVLQSKIMEDTTARTKAKGMAVQELLTLLKERPELQGVVYEQLMNQLPDAPDYKALDPLLLQAMMRKADQERVKGDDETADVKLIERGIASAQELISRKGKDGVDAQAAENAQLLIGLLYQKLDKKLEAGTAFLDFAQNFPTSGDNARIALEYATSMIAKLRQEGGATSEGYVKLYERFLPIAINKPFNRVEFAFEYAQLLQKSEKYADAATYYAMVGDSDKRALAARFFQMLAYKQQLDSEGAKLSGDARVKVLTNIQTLADQVTKMAEATVASAESEQAKNNGRGTLVRTALLAAEVARTEQKSPERVLQVLNGFEEKVAGLPREADLLAEALSLRVGALMAVGKNTEATEALVALLKKTGGKEGANIVYHLLEKLEGDLQKARNAGDMKQVKSIAASRADLSTFLVSWAKSNTDGSIRQYYYRYAVFDASSKKLAADLADAAVDRRAGREAALNLYQALLTPEMVHDYQRTLQGTNVNPNDPDPQVILGIGLLQYDLGNFEEARGNLAQLLNNRKLGTATTIVEKDGQDVVVDNEQYWEANLKLYRSNVEIANKDSKPELLENTATGLKRLYITWGDRTGGKRFGSDFKKLLDDIAPGFKYDSTGTEVATPATAPAEESSTEPSATETQ